MPDESGTEGSLPPSYFAWVTFGSPGGPERVYRRSGRSAGQVADRAEPRGLADWIRLLMAFSIPLLNRDVNHRNTPSQ
jgi:hypothetical protein